MQHTTYDFEAGFLFRKCYCVKCGTKLIRKKTEKVVKRGDPEHRKYNGTNQRYPFDILVKSFVWLCPNCGQETTYDEQMRYVKIQKKLKVKILDEQTIQRYAPPNDESE